MLPAFQLDIPFVPVLLATAAGFHLTKRMTDHDVKDLSLAQ